MRKGADDMDVDYDNAIGLSPSGVSDPEPLFATRTKPEHNNKFKKRLGAKKTKLLELEENASHILSPADATTYRALSARCNYLAQDRPDISYSSKELCREFAVPNANSYRKLKRLVRYLSGLPRLVYVYKWQTAPKSVDTFVDTDFAGCKETRRSTSGGAILIGDCCIRHYSKTQSTVSLSSGEAELHGIAQGAANALGVQALLKDLGWELKCNVHSDATAAIWDLQAQRVGKGQAFGLH